MGLILIDKSAWVRADPEEIERHGEPCLCAITHLEILFSATSPADYVEQQVALALFRDLRVDAQTMAPPRAPSMRSRRVASIGSAWWI